MLKEEARTSSESFDQRQAAARTAPQRPGRTGRVDLAQIPWVRPILESRWPQFAARSLTLAGFVFSILAGLFGSPVGSHNFAIIFVWIAWWTALKLLFIPLGGRSWCSVCPIPMPGDWLQQGGLLSLSGKRRGLRLSWPKRLRGSWLQASGFLLIGLFSAVTLTDARVTAWILAGLFLLATALSLIFERRAFCSYLCPIGGFTGIYAQTAPVEVRVKSTEVCKTHSEKTCYVNCPWGLYPVALRNSAQCGLCMECLRSCPEDNILVNLRPFGEDIQAPRQTKRLDEAFLALVMLGSVIAFSAVFLGPWGSLKSAAFAIGSAAWLLYALGFLALTLGVLPGLFALSVWAGQKWSQRLASLRVFPQRQAGRFDYAGSAQRAWCPDSLSARNGTVRQRYAPFRQSLANLSQALLPLGLFAWIAFTISFAFPKFSLVVAVLSDPFGWGWDLFGTANASWVPDGSSVAPLLQVIALCLGLVWSARVAIKVAGEGASKAGDSSWREALPVIGFSLLFTQTMFWLLIG